VVGPGPDFAGGEPGANIEDGSSLIIHWSSGSLGEGAVSLYRKKKFFELKFASFGAFLRASAMLKHVIDIGWTSVHLSVCHTLAPYQNG